MPRERKRKSSSAAPRRRVRLVVAIVLLVGLIVVVIYQVPRYAVHRADAAIAVRDFEQANRWLDTASRWGAPESELVMHRARIARLKGDSVATARWLRAAVAHRIPERRIDLEWLMADAQAGQTGELERQWLQMLDRYPEDGSELMYALVIGKMMNWEYQGAEQLLDTWQLGDPEDPRIYYLRGEVHRRQQQFEQAIESYRAAKLLAPRWLTVRIAEAATLNALRRYDEALQIFSELRTTAPDNADVLLGQARAAVESGRNEIAADAAAELIELHPEHEAGRLILAQAQQALSQHDAAIETLAPLLKKFPQHLQANQLGATAYAVVGEAEKSAEHAERYQMALDETQRWRRLEVSVPGRQDDAEFLYSLARMIYPFQPSESYSLLRKHVAMEPRSLDAYRMLAELAEMAGNTDVRDQYRRLIRRAETEAASGAPAAKSDGTSQSSAD